MKRRWWKSGGLRLEAGSFCLRPPASFLQPQTFHASR